MESQNLSLVLRKDLGKNRVKSMRDSGLTPGVLYGLGKDSISVSFDLRSLGAIFKSNPLGRNAIFTVSISGYDDPDCKVMVKSMQRHSVSMNVLHADFIRINESSKVKITVPIDLSGISPGVKKGGIFFKNIDRVSVSCLPQDIPASFKIDLSTLEIGNSIHSKNLVEGTNIELISDPNIIVVGVKAPRRSTVADTSE